MNHKKHATLLAVIGLVCLLMSATAYAAGNSPDTFGRGGTTPHIASNCQRLPMYLTPAGKSWDGASPNGKQFTSQGFAVMKAQIDCANRRTQRIMACFEKPVPTVTVYHGDDWKANNLEAAKNGIDTPGPDGVDALQAYIVAENQCVAAVTGVKG